MGRRSSFGSRLGAYRNRQIRLAIGRSNRSYRKVATTNDPPDPNATMIGLAMIALFIGGVICFLSSMAQ
jgi:hypothetical protein